MLTNVTFRVNSALMGGGLYNLMSSPTLTNVTFNGNSSTRGSYGAAIFNSDSNSIVKNSILWGNTPDQIYNFSGTLDVSYSVIQGNYFQGGYSGPGNIDADPKLGTFGNNGGYTQTFPLLPGSVALNTGDTATCASTDQRGVIRPQGAGCDIGAYEVQAVIISGNTGVGGTKLVYTDGVSTFVMSDDNGNYSLPVSIG
jgi:hypothetical protein